ncbi:crotonobetainyl-CoA:carnitine CoA-transferase CaiB-like acyl-CoA transferase [Nocardioides sp. J9]|uniref:CaiB/BaiF CoA transferase family protein n=1 Tax=Nocardioides sp. J9 TaxID=935844 RepID=UPI0011AD69CF|nr:CoA transferase [Nocardioides sp. J9]TWG98578.1 crotonobetainyl-CoA:carnitine CoA-transferase CaiB-like acyl-CoA transferase [Nocardioides sp. J9]
MRNGPSSDDTMSGSVAGALDGILVADFSRVLAGPYLTMLLGDLGATVIKVESPEGDQTRGWGPPWRDGETTYFRGVNRNKRSIVLDLKKAEDQALARELALRADVLVENLLPGRMKSFGLDYAALQPANPGLVYCSLSGFGSQPRGARLPGFDLVAQAAGGLMSITGSAEGTPMKVGVAVVDVLCGLHGGMGVLAALAARASHGRGQLVEVNLLASTLSGLANQAAAFLMAGEVPGRLGNAHPSVVPYEVFEVADGDVVIAAGTERQFRQLCSVLDLGELLGDERFATNVARVQNRVLLRKILCDRLAGFTRAEATEALSAAGVPVGPVNDIADAFKLARDLDLEMLWRIDGIDHVRSPFFLSENAPTPRSGAPSLDADGADLREWLSAEHFPGTGGPGASGPRPAHP